MADAAAGRTAARRELASFAFAANCVIDLRNAVIVDVEAATAIQPEAQHCSSESVSGAPPGRWRCRIAAGVREKFGLEPNLC